MITLFGAPGKADYRHVNKGHGRIEERSIRISTDLYYPYYEYGSGGWSEDGYHTASFFSGQRHSIKSIWCG